MGGRCGKVEEEAEEGFEFEGIEADLREEEGEPEDRDDRGIDEDEAVERMREEVEAVELDEEEFLRSVV